MILLANLLLFCADQEVGVWFKAGYSRGLQDSLGVIRQDLTQLADNRVYANNIELRNIVDGTRTMLKEIGSIGELRQRIDEINRKAQLKDSFEYKEPDQERNIPAHSEMREIKVCSGHRDTRNFYYKSDARSWNSDRASYYRGCADIYSPSVSTGDKFVEDGVPQFFAWLHPAYYLMSFDAYVVYKHREDSASCSSYTRQNRSVHVPARQEIQPGQTFQCDVTEFKKHLQNLLTEVDKQIRMEQLSREEDLGRRSSERSRSHSASRA